MFNFQKTKFLSIIKVLLQVSVHKQMVCCIIFDNNLEMIDLFFKESHVFSNPLSFLKWIWISEV